MMDTVDDRWYRIIELYSLKGPQGSSLPTPWNAGILDRQTDRFPFVIGITLSNWLLSLCSPEGREGRYKCGKHGLESLWTQQVPVPASKLPLFCGFQSYTGKFKVLQIKWALFFLHNKPRIFVVKNMTAAWHDTLELWRQSRMSAQ